MPGIMELEVATHYYGVWSVGCDACVSAIRQMSGRNNVFVVVCLLYPEIYG